MPGHRCMCACVRMCMVCGGRDLDVCITRVHKELGIHFEKSMFQDVHHSAWALPRPTCPAAFHFRSTKFPTHQGKSGCLTEREALFQTTPQGLLLSSEDNALPDPEFLAVLFLQVMGGAWSAGTSECKLSSEQTWAWDFSYGAPSAQCLVTSPDVLFSNSGARNIKGTVLDFPSSCFEDSQCDPFSVGGVGEWKFPSGNMNWVS